jgi:hypothetical protein
VAQKRFERARNWIAADEPGIGVKKYDVPGREKADSRESWQIPASRRSCDPQIQAIPLADEPFRFFSELRSVLRVRTPLDPVVKLGNASTFASG